MALYPVLIRARALTGFAPLVSKHGGDPLALLDAVGIPRHILETPEATVALDQLIRLIERAASVLDIDAFGLQLATYQDISVLGPVASIARHARTVREAFDAIRRYLPYHTPGGKLSIAPAADADHAAIHYELSLAPDAPRRHAVELSFAIACQFLRMVVPAGASGCSLHFRHAMGLSLERYQRYFDMDVSFGQQHDALIVPLALLDIAIDESNPELGHMAETFVANVVKRFPLDLARQVETLAARQLAMGGCSLAGIARQLALNERTLQRRLADQGYIFEQIVDSLRQERAAEFLPHSAIPLVQVAAMLGYNDQSSFNRACKRWFGKTPMQLRARAG